MQDAKRTEEEATQQDNKIINVSCILFTKGKMLKPRTGSKDAYCQRSARRWPGCLEPECVRTEVVLLASRLSECTPYSAGRESTEA